MKIKVGLIEKEECAGADGTIVNLEFYPSSDGSPENRAAFRYSPQGCIRLYGLTPEAAAGFEVGKKYFVDITAAA